MEQSETDVRDPYDFASFYKPHPPRRAISGGQGDEPRLSPKEMK